MLNTKKSINVNVKSRFLLGKKKFAKFILLITVSLSVHIATAQETASHAPKYTPEQKAERISAHLKQQLSLSDDQTEKVKAVYLGQVQKIEAGDEKRKEAHEEVEKSLSQILTADQLAKFKEIESQRREQMKNHKDKKMSPAPDGQEPNQSDNQQDNSK
jgi:protein CpxP